MEKNYPALLLDANDNVVTATSPVAAGTMVADGVAAQEDIPFGFKIAIRRIREGGEVYKYGVPVARARAAVEAGYCVHIHNAASAFDKRSAGFDAQTAAPADMSYEIPEEKTGEKVE